MVCTRSAARTTSRRVEKKGVPVYPIGCLEIKRAHNRFKI